MITYDLRMIEGSPLQYYNYTSNAPPSLSSNFSYFNRFEVPLSPRMSEEFISPTSPHCTQSDSDNSLSSIDVTPEPILRRTVVSGSSQNTQTDAQCCWRSCGIIFDTLDQLSEHVSKVHAISGLGGLYYCGWEGCIRNNKGFNARYKMLVHVRTHTNEKPHQCTQCHKSFSRAENLKIHSRSHSGEKPYVCPVPGCSKAYSNSSDRFKHTRTHQVDKPYQCKVPGCPKRYTDPSSLRKHVKTYKHFVNENNQKVNNENLIITERIVDVDRREKTEIRTHPVEQTYNTNRSVEQMYQENAGQQCLCNHTCYLSKCLNLGALINLSSSDVKPWNNFIDPFIVDPKRLYSSTYHIKEEHVDIDVPLDLSISRKHL